MNDGPVAVQTRTVYGRDLYDNTFNLNVRINTDAFEHGNTVRVSVEKLEKSPDRDIEPADD